MLTHEAPLAVFTSAFSSGQSASRRSVGHRLGLAVCSSRRCRCRRRSRPIAIGADSSPEATISLNARPAAARSPAEPADPGGQALNATLARHREPSPQPLVLREQRGDGPIGLRDVLGRPTAPPIGTGPCPQNIGRTNAGTNPGYA
jgi:hypothetical protein